MANVIVAFSRQEDARNIKNILVRSGFQVFAVCTSGAQTLSQAEDLSSGIIVCGYRLTDMLFAELSECMPTGFDMLMVSSPRKWTAGTPENVVFLPMPLKVHDLVATLDMMAQAQDRRRRKQRQQPKKRNEEEQQLINRAKGLLMERNGMTEEEAHRYIQKCSMDSGTNLIETAQMVISLINL
ncbi:MAG: ANTAR domain-containing protein [Clostridiales bacterium]|nr:ANTAR domain-containing protein [Clostridiales bacterium]MCD8369382.1 ANTAR domain-containing protein [Clostridiales bacterium]